jgi:hypothetical protein
MARPDTGQDESRYVPVAEAAVLLGIKPDSVRKAIRRRTLQAIKPTGSGEWLVLVDSVQDTASRPSVRPVSHTTPRTDSQDTVLLAAILATLERQNGLLERLIERLEDTGQDVLDTVQPVQPVPPRRPSWLKRAIYGPTGAPP